MRRNSVLMGLMLLILGGLAFFALRYQWPGDREPAVRMTGGDADRGRQALLAHGCSGCHVIAGIRRATGRVGPKLEDISQQIYLAGVLTNTPDNMARWIMNPQEYSPETAMPDLDVGEEDARNIGAYLYRQP